MGNSSDMKTPFTEWESITSQQAVEAWNERHDIAASDRELTLVLL